MTGRGGGTHGVESAEAFVLDDAAGDGEGTAGGAELKANLRDERGADGTGGARSIDVGACAIDVAGGAGAREMTRGDGSRRARRCSRGGGDASRAARRRAARRRARRSRAAGRRRAEARETHLDDIEGLDDAGGAHAGEAAVHERLDRLPGGVIGERHGVGRVVGFGRLRGAGVTRDRRRRCLIATVEARSAGRLQRREDSGGSGPRRTNRREPDHLIGG